MGFAFRGNSCNNKERWHTNCGVKRYVFTLKSTISAGTKGIAHKHSTKENENSSMISCYRRKKRQVILLKMKLCLVKLSLYIFLSVFLCYVRLLVFIASCFDLLFWPVPFFYFV